ncbi:MAG: polysulfide reductase, partial [Acidimicrobiales bacterium]|nr:polysulfide reductase [Acidimicrobiales bacterium]
AGIGPAVAAYTSVLIADTAVPAWHEARGELPYLFVSSAAAAATGWGLVWSPLDDHGPLRRLAPLAAAAEVGIERRMEQRLGMVGEPYSTGRAGALLRWARVLTVAGGVGGALFGRRSRVGATVSGLALLAGSACTRFGVFEAGLASADDPKYTVGPQRERRNARDPAALAPTP